jgi:glycosyltransferase involved in cell wall biosynthesis
MISTPFLAVPPKDYGGTELVVSQLTEGLVARGHEVTVFATGDSRTTAELRWLYESAEWPPQPLTDLNHSMWALGEVQLGEYDVIHVHSATALSAHRLMPDLPLVYTMHHVREEALSAFYAHHPRVTYVAISADQASREVSLPDVTVIHHGLDPRGYEWTSRPDDYVAFLGRLAPIKGAHTAIDAAEAAGVPIRVAGAVHDEDRAFGDREIAPRLARPHVTHLGTIGMEAKRVLLRDARALLAPIEWNEPFGLVLIEAMLSGCPVIAYPRGSVPELVESGVTGFIVRDRDELTALLRAGSALHAFDRRRCRMRAAERFSCDRMVREYESLYARVARRARRSLLIA